MISDDDEYETPEKTRMRNEWAGGRHKMNDKDKQFDIIIPGLPDTIIKVGDMVNGKVIANMTYHMIEGESENDRKD